MTAASLGEAEFLGALQALVPQGPAWPRDPDARLTGFLSAMAARHAALHARAADLSERESDPSQTAELLPDWERAFGLPDECAAGQTLLSARRAALVSRLAERRSPTPAAIEEVAAAFGVRASVVEYREHTCEMDCEAAVIGTPWVHAFDVWSGTRVITEATAEDDCMQPLRVWVSAPHECAVRRMAPAHSVPLFQSFTDEFNLLSGLPAGGAVARTGNATRVDERGLLAVVSDNAARLTYDPAQAYNLVPHPWGDGTTAPTVPNGWGVTNGSSVTIAFIGSGVRDGIAYTRWRVSGTATGAAGLQIRPVNVAVVPAVSGQTFCGQMHVEVVRVGAGNTADVGAPSVSMVGHDAATTLQSEISHSSPIGQGRTFASGPARVSRTMNNSGTGSITIRLTIGNTAGVVHDWDVDIGFPILNEGATYLADTIPLATLAARDNGVPQYGLLGLLNEPAANNFVPNPRGEGAVVGVIGSGGAAPTDWGTVSAGGGLATQIVGTGTEAGVPYVDIRWSGTASAAGFITVQFLSTAVAPIAAWDQTWTASAFRRLVGGSFAGLFNARLNITEYLGATFLVGTSSLSTPTSGPLAVQRASVVRRLTDPFVDRVICSWAASFNAGAVVDITMRLGAPQLEQGPLSSVMLPSAGFPGVASRSAEALSIPAPTGGYSADITAATPSGAVATYAASGLTSMQGSLHVAHPAAAVDAGATAIRTIQLRKVR